MNSIQSILVVMDSASDHQAALIQGIKIAKKTSARIDLFLVAYNGQFVSHFNFNQAQLDLLKADYLVKEIEWLNEFIPDIEAAGIEVTTDITWHPDASTAILAKAKRTDSSMVIKSTKNDSLINKIFFTPNDWQLLEHCSVPLLLTKNISDYSYQKIVATVNPDKQEEGAEELNNDILANALNMAEIYGGKAHVCHCFQPLAKDIWQALYSKNEEAGSNFTDYTNARAKHQKTSFDKLLSDYAFEDECTHLIAGAPEDELPRFAKEQHVDLLVMGMNNNGKFIGNTVEEVLGYIDCDLLSIKNVKSLD